MGSVLFATEEHRGMFRAERRKSSERGPFHRYRPAHYPAARHFLGHPFPQQFLQLSLKVVLCPVAIKGGLEVPSLGQKPFLKEELEHLPIAFDGCAVRIIDRDGGRRTREA